MDSRNDNECDRLGLIVPSMAGTFKALGDLTRLRIIYLLSTDTTGTLGVGELATRLGITQPAVSQALKALRGEGLVDSRREGLYVYYTINRDRIVQFREHFELMYASVMENADRELVRKATRCHKLNACVIFYSYSGVTRALASQIRNAFGCDLIEVKAKREYSAFSVYTTGVLHSLKHSCDPILPEIIDVSKYDLLVIGYPVWVGNPAPPINSAVRALLSCEGKKAVIFITSCGQPGEALAFIRAALTTRGVKVVSECCLTEKDTGNQNAGNEIIGRIVAAYPAPVSPEEESVIHGITTGTGEPGLPRERDP
jgi:DNA-binding transcriptional ArsR family regulator